MNPQKEKIEILRARFIFPSLPSISLEALEIVSSLISDKIISVAHSQELQNQWILYSENQRQLGLILAILFQSNGEVHLSLDAGFLKKKF